MDVLGGRKRKKCQKVILTARKGGTGKRERPRTIWTNAFEDYLKIIGIRN
jgi:hypothetical protein